MTNGLAVTTLSGLLLVQFGLTQTQSTLRFFFLFPSPLAANLDFVDSIARRLIQMEWIMYLTFNSLLDYLWQRVSLRNLEVFQEKSKI